MEAIPQRRPYLILVRLRRKPEWCEDDIRRLHGVLPACSRGVLFDERVIGIATMTELGPTEILQQYGRELRPFVTIGVIELGRLSASTDSASDPFYSWMEENVRQGKRRESDEAEDMMKKKWGQRRVEDTKDRSVADTIREVFSRSRPR